MSASRFGLALCCAATACLASFSARAEPTGYPLTIENCGQPVTFAAAPKRAVALGQNSAEIMLLLGLEDRMAATAFWPTNVLPDLATHEIPGGVPSIAPAAGEGTVEETTEEKA